MSEQIKQETEIVTLPQLDLKLLEKQLDNAGEMGCVSVSDVMRILRMHVPKTCRVYCPECAGSLITVGISGNGTIYRCHTCRRKFTF